MEEIIILAVQIVLSALWTFLRVVLDFRDPERFRIHLQF